jgi:hypothetical protein
MAHPEKRLERLHLTPTHAAHIRTRIIQRVRAHPIPPCEGARAGKTKGTKIVC